MASCTCRCSTAARFAKNLGFTLGARASDHSVSGTAESYKLEGTWQPLEAVRVRSSYQRAVRAPSITELFSPADQNFPSLLEDPCNADSIGAHHGCERGRRARRQWQGARPVRGAGNSGWRTSIRSPAARVGQVETFGGGNPDLKEETADTYTFGVVLDSPWEGAFSNLHASIDYYNINLKDAIFSVPAGEIVLLCYGYAGNNPNLDVNDPACRSINRVTDSRGNPSDGTPWVPSQGTANVSAARTPSGIDLQVDWGFDLGKAGHSRFQPDGQLAAEVGDRLSTLDRGDRLHGHHRRPGGIGACPDYKLFLNTHWNRGPFGSGPARALPAGDGQQVRELRPRQRRWACPSVTYLDVNASWKFGDYGGPAPGRRECHRRTAAAVHAPPSR